MKSIFLSLSAKAQYEALKAEIRANGIRKPIKYVEHGGKKYIVDGHHRLLAAQELGIKDVPGRGLSFRMAATGRRMTFWTSLTIQGNRHGNLAVRHSCDSS